MPKILICGLNNSKNFKKSMNKETISMQNTIIPKTNNVLNILSISLLAH